MFNVFTLFTHRQAYSPLLLAVNGTGLTEIDFQFKKIYFFKLILGKTKFVISDTKKILKH